MAARAKRTRRRQRAKWLIFVDTNILLDFYRLPGASATRTLAQLEKHRGSLILTDQVWMEFLKNRQKVITQTIREFVKPVNSKTPSFLNDAQAAKTFTSHQKKAQAQYERVIAQIEKALRDPARHDKVFKSLARIFSHESSLNLKRPSKRRYAIRHLARKRFGLGYPPRKDDTLKMGDAINWEWMIECASESPGRENIVIVSRDGDFGTFYGKEAILNDWLRLEFKERVSRKRKIELRNTLSAALKLLDVNVSESDAEEERIVATAMPEYEAP